MLIRDRILGVLHARAADLLGDQPVPDLELGRAKNPAHGEFASSAGMKLARALRRPPPAIAADLAEAIRASGELTGVCRVEAAGGYVNFRLEESWLQALVGEVAGAGPAYGASRMGGGEKVQVEFVSVNPTGPLHIGHGRGAILGDTLCRLLAFTGHDVQREYYVNDENTQARKFVQSVYARLHGQEPPEGGYLGDYVVEIAGAARSELPGIESCSETEAESLLREYAIGRMVEMIKASLERLGVHFDEWYRESRIWSEGLGARAIQRLRERGYLVDRDGAVWFVAPAEVGGGEAGEGDPAAGAEDQRFSDEDRVVIRSNGEHTYFASDLGYLLSKFEVRGFHRVIDIWGADHHGYIARIKAGAAALGFDPDRLVIIINQIVHLKEGRMSKRAGRMVLLDDLVDRVGPDPVRFFFMLRSPDAMMEFDLELAASQSKENPVYYVQYAHARMANAEAYARQQSLPESPDLSLLTQPWELDVMRQLAFWPEVVEAAAASLEPHRIPFYLHELADRVHAFYQAGNRDWRHRIVSADPELTRARLELARAARNTLRSGLDLMGVSAPERM